MENSELKWLNQGESAYLVAVATLAAGILQRDRPNFIEDTERAVKIAVKVLDQVISGETK